MNTKKMTAFIVGAMLIATVLVMAVNAADNDNRVDYLGMPRMVYEYDAVDDTGLYINYNETEEEVTVRVYGEEGAIYPTQSYTGADDFIYPDAVDPFDPGVIAKDSVTFNPAYIDDNYYDGHKTLTLRVDGHNADEKVFFRTFYEPGYEHPADAKMDNAGSGSYSVVMENGALVTETTYMLLLDNEGAVPPTPGHSGLPYAGAAKDDDGNFITYFMLPTHSSDLDDNKPGMDRGRIVNLNYASGMNTPQLTDGEIEVQRYMKVLDEDRKVSFMDHQIKFKGATAPLGKVRLDISYIGNMKGVDTQKTSHTVDQNSKWYVDRLNGIHSSIDPDWRFYFEIGEMYGDVQDGYEVEITVGRYLAAGETFYVDGVRYDMPAIYVTDDDKFKYITFQSPLPKCEDDVWFGDGPDSDPRNQADMSHVTCQWLANLLPGDEVYVLPPFNYDHLMIDDIGREKIDNGDWDGDVWVPDWEICTEAGNIIDNDRGKLKFWYVAEEVEERFNTSLAERHARKDGVEIWNWWSIFTKPDHYTELYLPDQENATDDTYIEDDCGRVDGNEYLITTSFIAPNSEGPERDVLSKSTVDVHDIIDRADDIAVDGDDRRLNHLGMPRMAFEFDAVDDTDFFVNYNETEDEVTVRVYGEEGAIYPTHSFTGEDDFIYPDAVDPFDPGVIGKDSVTFNPAYIDDAYDGDNSRTLRVDGHNADEKVFFRTFYEPGYEHPADAKMDNAGSGSYPVVMENGALVTETTYMLLLDNEGTVPPTPGHSGLPYAGAPKDADGNFITYFMLPTHSDCGDNEPGMDEARIVNLNYADGMSTSQLTDGEIEVQRIMKVLDEDGQVRFMDHQINFRGATAPLGKVRLDIRYLGNMRDVDTQKTTHTVDQNSKWYVDRLNGIHSDPDPDWRFYFEIGEMYGDVQDGYEVEITVGRYLAAGETFYVDGVRYDMPAIYVTDDDKFKYITFQSPLPKCSDEVWFGDGPASDPRNQADMSHVTCQWLANQLPGEYVYLLPPFDEDHLMIDDIGLVKFDNGVDADWEICTEAGNILEDEKGELEFWYVAEEVEERFDTSLAERLNSDGTVEIWNWWSIFTKPDHYTELNLPDDENAGDTYVDDSCGLVDGNEYLITTSFIAPNSEGPERELLSKSTVDVHDIIDRASTLVDDGPALTCGDVNCNDVVNMGDVTLLLNHVSYPSNSAYDICDDWTGDVTGDGNVNMGDVTLLLNHVSYPSNSAYDLNCA